MTKIESFLFPPLVVLQTALSMLTLHKWPKQFEITQISIKIVIRYCYNSALIADIFD